MKRRCSETWGPVRCELLEGHPGDHRGADMLWSSKAPVKKPRWMAHLKAKDLTHWGGAL